MQMKQMLAHSIHPLWTAERIEDFESTTIKKNLKTIYNNINNMEICKKYINNWRGQSFWLNENEPNKLNNTWFIVDVMQNKRIRIKI